MEGRYRKNKSKNSSRFYILMSVIFVVVMFKWGIPLFVSFVSGPDSKAEIGVYSDNLPPQTPILSAIPEATNSSSLTINGYTQPKAVCQLILNDALTSEVTANEQGYFEFLTKLTSGENSLVVNAKNDLGLTSQSSTNIVNYDSTAIKITNLSPADGESVFGINNKNIKITGKINKDQATVLINGSWANLNSDGEFTANMTLNDGENEIKIEVTDKAGNSTNSMTKINYIP